MSTPLSSLKDSIDEVKANIRKGVSDPQNEIDFNACIYHTWLSLHPDDSRFLHLEARVKNYKESKGQYRGHADLAYGEASVNPKTRRKWIEKPELVVESKSFRGFTRNQKTTRQKRVRKDIEKLGSANLDGRAVRVVTVLKDEEEQRIPESFWNDINNLGLKQKNKVHLLIV